MSENKFLPILLSAIFIVALVLFVFFFGPKAPSENMLNENISASTQLEQKDDNSIVELDNVSNIEEKVEQSLQEQIETQKELSKDLQSVKEGKSSIISMIFSGADLNAKLSELLEISEVGEAWADFAIGQVAEMCTYLHETPETQLIQMFTSNNRGVNAAQQAQFSELLPMVLDASKRCKTLDKNQLTALGNPRDWFDKAAEANHPSAFVSSGYSLISAQVREESEELPEQNSEDLQALRSELRVKATKQFRQQMRENLAEGRFNPEAVMSMSEHLNLFYEDDHPYKSKEAWMLLACDQGYENNCGADSQAMSMFCMFDPSCSSGGNFQEGVVWEQGQFKYDEYRRTADELKQIFESKDWDRLGF